MRFNVGFRGVVSDALRTAGIEIRRKPPILVRSEHELHIDLEHAAAHLAAFNPGAQFTALQVGAFDGITNDPLESSIRAFGWRAVLVEPQPVPFTALQSRYSGTSSVQVFNVAIGDHDGTRLLYMLEPSDDLPSWSTQIASFDRAHLDVQQRQFPRVDIGARVRTVEVTTWTFDTLLDHSGTSQVDVLQLDTEGYDYELLKRFDVPRRRPAIIHYEHQHLSRAHRNAAADLLVKCGYRLAMSHEAAGDTLAVRH